MKRSTPSIHWRAFSALALAATLLAACGAKQHPHDDAPMTIEEAENELLDADIYACDNDVEIRAAYPDVDIAVVQYRGDIHILRQAVSADGARYTDERIEWWVKGAGPDAEATVFQHTEDGTGDTLESNCSPR